MLEIARSKGLRRTLLADALHLPFRDGEFDCLTVAFGLRNMEDWGAALQELARVLSPGGHLLVLDFSLPSPPLRGLYRWYLHQGLPRLAAALTGEKGAYQYLGASIEEFPRGKAMLQLFEANGFTDPRARPMTAGIVTMYTGTKA